MLKLQKRGSQYFYSIFLNPVARVLKFKKFASYYSKLPSGNTVLDYGAGDKPLAPFLKTRFTTYIAADYAPSNAAHSLRPDVLITEEGLDIESESVDCVVLTEVLEHIYEPKEALKEISRILKPGGAIIGTVPFAVGEHEEPYDFHRYTSFCLKRMFSDCDFEILELEYVGDTIGVLLSNFSRTLGFVSKILFRLKLGPVAKLYNAIIRIPEWIYFLALQIGLNPGRVKYFRANPFGFSFYVVKPTDKLPVC